MNCRNFLMAGAPSGEQFAAQMRSVENPSTPLSAGADWMYDVFGAIRSASGVRVNRKTVFTYGPVWRAVALIARDVAKLPLYVHKIADEGETKHRDKQHPAYRLLRRKPNQEQTAHAWKLLVMAHTLVEGNGYSYIFRRGDGSPLDVVPLLPDRTYPVRKNGVLWYITTVNGEMRRLAPEDVLHFKGLGFDGLSGYPLYQFARDSLGLGMAAQKYGAKFFANNAEPSVVLEVPGTMDEEVIKNLRESWDRMHGGLENAHRPAILEEGVTLKPFGSSARQAQLLELLQFSSKEVANWFHLPVHKLGDTDTTSYASREEANQEYLDDALDPWLCQIEEECWDKLLTEEEKELDSHSVDFDRLSLERANTATRTTYFTAALNAGWMNVDEVRARENLNPVPDGAGKIFRAPLNMGVAGAEPAADGDDAGGDADGGDDSAGDDSRAARQGDKETRRQGDKETRRQGEWLTPIVTDAVRRMVRRLGVAARKAAKRPEQWASWYEQFDLEHRETVAEVFAPLETAIRAVGGENGASETLEKALFSRVRDDIDALFRAFDAQTLGPAIERHFAAHELAMARDITGQILSDEKRAA